MPHDPIASNKYRRGCRDRYGTDLSTVHESEGAVIIKSYSGKGRQSNRQNNNNSSSSRNFHNRVKPAAGISPPYVNVSGVFSGQNTGYHGTGAGATQYANPAHTQPFTNAILRLQNKHHANPFSNLRAANQKAPGYDFVRACAVDELGQPLFDKNTSSGSFYLQYLSQISDGRGELHPVFRTRALQQLLEVGSVEQVCAEVFHFMSGVLQCKYGDGYMRDDLIMCDCDGTVPVCFMRAYLDERAQREYYRKRAETIEAKFRELAEAA